jgi:diguanylate cyclase (GGDEF)-like protein
LIRTVVVFDVDRERRKELAQAVRDLGADPLEANASAILRVSRKASLVIAAGEEGVEVLARLSLDRPHLPRIALVDRSLPQDYLLGVIERAHPWALLLDPVEPERFAASVRDALASTSEGNPTDLTNRIVRLPVAQDFAHLVADQLTGADNYHYLRLRLDEELERASRYTRPLSLVLVDVDDLRGINDRYGRPAGDFALKQVATALTAGARIVDRVGRWAGGTFALVLPETTAGAALGIAERLRADIAARRFSGAVPGEVRVPPRLRLTVSCGIASTVKEGAPRPQSLIARADGALFRAKNGGRNRSAADT